MLRDRYARLIADRIYSNSNEAHWEKLNESAQKFCYDLADLLIQAIPEITGEWLFDEYMKALKSKYILSPSEQFILLATAIMRKIRGEE